MRVNRLLLRCAELESLLTLLQHGACKCAHHAKKDQHGYDTPCPIEARISAILSEKTRKTVKHRSTTKA